MGLLTALFIGFLSLATLNVAFCNGGCKESERQALLKLKQDMVDPADRLASWVADDEDCCRWKGVVCDNVAGHVLELNLSDVNNDQLEARLGGKISPSLLRLKHLRYLDLSNNYFGEIHIPKFFGSLKSLRILDLSQSGFAGEVPHHLGNLSNLKYLNLQENWNLHVENFQWLSGLSSLEYLNLNFVNLSGASNWFHVVNALPSLVELRLHLCELESHYLVPPFTSVNLSSLVVLDLSYNHFRYLSKVKWVFGLNKLIFLDLSGNQFQGPIPYDLQNLTLLRNLDLSSNNFNSSIPDWLGNFSHLESLFLSDENFNFEGDIPIRSIGKLCNLSFFGIFDFKSSLKISHILEIFSAGCISKSLEFLRLHRCQLSGQLTNQLGNFKSLRELYLFDNLISGPIPTSIGELQSLEYLDLSGNKLNGSVPESFGQLANLQYVDISNNSFDGSLPKSFGQLANLESVDISQNSFKGTVSEIHFVNLEKLYNFIADGNPSMILKVNFDWVPHFQIRILRLGSWCLGWQFPQWLHSQKYLRYLDISDSKIVDEVPNWFWELSSQCIYLNISHNQIHGHLPRNLNSFGPADPSGIIVFDFSSNNFIGPLSRISSNVSFLDLSNNNLSGSLFNFLCHERNESMSMMFLNLGQNFLSGELPDCWAKWPNLEAIVLSSNRLTGGIPRSIGTLSNLVSLHLQKNNLSGEIPLSLSNCTGLEMLQLSENELDGSIPPWVGKNLSNLIILNLGSNEFSEHIPNELCSLNSLQILDLAHNNLFGSLPGCIGNISVLLSSDNHSQGFDFGSLFSYGSMFEVAYLENAFVSIKGQLREYDKILHLVKVMDFSGNSLSGEIPSEITYLQGLQSLNLSHNHFTGRIPRNIGNMRMLESLDFSGNNVSGSIPESMSSLTFLSYLNLSNNQLTGQIPSSTQLQSFNASSYVGNKLCGLPLPNKCSVNRSFVPSIQNRGGKDGNGIEIIWFYASVALGFIVGFWSVLGPLVISKEWRCTYYQFLEEMWWKIIDSVNKCF